MAIEFQAEYAGFSIQQLYQHLKDDMAKAKQEGTYRDEIVLESKQGSTVTIAGKNIVMLASNNYLGLANHPRLVQAARKALDLYGYGLASVPILSGIQAIHKQLEQRIGKFVGCEDAMLFPSCFMANTGFFDAFLKNSLTDHKDIIYSDTSNHPSVSYGIKIALASSNKVNTRFYDNNDITQLTNFLQSDSSASNGHTTIIVTSGVFYTTGEMSQLKSLLKLKDQYQAILYVDDSHGTGIIGTNGRGTAEAQDVLGKPDFIAGTFGKALGGACGGFIAGTKSVIEYLRQKTVTYTNSNSLPPAIVCASIEALNILEEDNSLVSRLHENSVYFRTGLKNLGFNISSGNHPIVLIMIGDELKAKTASTELLQAGVYCREIGFPMVAKGTARLRAQVSAAHSKEELNRALEAFASVDKKMKLITPI